ncbi:response regulator [Candidatus Sumerlaeota bacterium]|nr:response regulator [Candidatus Sumerlaeota bacterium]
MADDWKWRVLAVDDEPNILNIVLESLKNDFEVLTLDRPIMTMNIIRLFQPDLVILDIMMPKMNGYHIAEMIKKDYQYQHIKVMFLTAKDKQFDIKTGYSRGADLYITKPFTPDRLLRNIKMLFQQNPPRRQSRNLAMSEVLARIAYADSNEDLGEHLMHKTDRSASVTTPVPEAEKDPETGKTAAEEERSEERRWMG